ncbi:MAG TPA: ATP-binding protein [Anaerolineae bacterium]|nr:ATP-binding protein [Anaerolineae bacterium]
MKSIARSLPLLVIAVVLLVALVTALTSSFLARDELEQAVQHNLETLALAQSQQIEQVLRQQISRANTLAQQTDLQTEVQVANNGYNRFSVAEREQLLAADSQAWRAARGKDDPGSTEIVRGVDLNRITAFTFEPLKEDLLTSVGVTNDFLLVDEAGAIIAATYLPISYLAVQSNWWQAMEAGQATFLQGPVQTQADGGQQFLELAVPVMINGSREGVLLSRFDYHLIEQIIDQLQFNDASQTLIVNNEGVVTYAPERLAALEGEEVDIEAMISGLSSLETEQGTMLLTGVALFSEVEGINNLDWYVVGVQSQSQALAPVTTAVLPTLGISLVIAIIAVSLVYMGYIRPLTMDIVRLHEGAQKLQEGDFSVTVGVERLDELGVLATTFNQMASDIDLSYGDLERRVQLRTAELAARVNQLNLITQTSQGITSLLSPAELLPQIAELMRATFDYYAVLIFLVDRPQGVIYVAAADTAEAVDIVGRESVLKLGDEGIAGYVAMTGDPMVVDDVTQEVRYYYDERLPDTKSELALPLRVGGQIFGVLDLQSTELATFRNEDVQVLQTLADQISISIRNSELFDMAQDARAEAEHANALKTQFLANMSHELRTPLNSIINFTYLLTLGVEGPVNEGQTEMLERISNAGKHLLDLINDILDLAKIEAGRMELFIEDIKLQKMVPDVMATVHSLVKDKPVVVEHLIAGDLIAVPGDRTRIRQVLLNLLSNAVKFTDEGHVTVSAEQVEGQVIISVTDTGMGISKDDLEKIFAEFVQADGSMTRAKGGTGLGLPISKRFVELHGGKMWAESEVGVGSTFYFSLPVV